MEDLVSIITPSYNTEKYIGDTIKSVQAQTYMNWEMIIVDDCSTDNTDEIVQSFLADKRIQYIKNEKNNGAAYCRNCALRIAKGKWIAFLDSDDIWMPDKLNRQVNFMESKGYKFTYTNYSEIDSDSNESSVIISGPRRITKRKMYDYCWPGCLTVMYDREFIGLIQIKGIKKNNDYAMWLKVIEKAECYLLDEVLAQYRRGRKGSISTHGYKTMIEWHYKLFRNEEEKSVVSSMMYTVRNIVWGIYKKTRYQNINKRVEKNER